MGENKDNDAYEEELIDYEEEDEKAPDSVTVITNGESIKNFSDLRSSTELPTIDSSSSGRSELPALAKEVARVEAVRLYDVTKGSSGEGKLGALSRSRFLNNYNLESMFCLRARILESIYFLSEVC
ncbi:hypothetical protein AgCh_000331 [Apium graveolens]